MVHYADLDGVVGFFHELLRARTEPTRLHKA
jgi:hypothetical protein